MEQALYFAVRSVLTKHMQIMMRINAVNAKKGMVMKPNQLIYSDEQGTP